MSDRVKKRLRNKVVIRKKITGTKERPRLVVFRSHKHIYVQLINDQDGKTLFSASSLKQDKKETGCLKASLVGKKIAEASLKKGVKKVVFDRNGYLYHGRVRAMADGAREGGLEF